MACFQTGQIVKMWCVNSDIVQFKIKCHNNLCLCLPHNCVGMGMHIF